MVAIQRQQGRKHGVPPVSAAPNQLIVVQLFAQAVLECLLRGLTLVVVVRHQLGAQIVERQDEQVTVKGERHQILRQLGQTLGYEAVARFPQDLEPEQETP